IPLFGKNTRDAIAAGVIRGVAYEVKGYMRTLHEKVQHFQTYLTGGNAPYILNNVRTSRTEKRELHHEKYLVLIGLNQILVHNKK
ncbi:MAG: pantothenate kinase, partial [Paludibacteraceae bacterium]|nr:pantothenate kinase [Paludibacteraceae bacterium]